MSELRVQKYIADSGICSRRKAESYIDDGLVFVNGKKLTERGIKVDPKNDIVEVRFPDGRVETCSLEAKNYVYIALHKPVGYISSASNEQGESVLDLITGDNLMGPGDKHMTQRVYPVGRLDKDSEGLILLTNDGELTQQLTHPSFAHEKEYEVTLSEGLSRAAEKVLTSGMRLDEEFVQGITIKKQQRAGRKSIVTVILREGKNRQIRRMFGQLGYNILKLKRTRMGNVKLGVLPVGRWKYVKKEWIFS